MEDLKSLIINVQNGNTDFFNTIVHQFQDMAVGYAYSILGDFHLAEDAAQEAFIDAYRFLSKLRSPEAFPGWFRKIVFKHCDRFTRGKRAELVSLEKAVKIPSEKNDPVEIALRNELLEKVSSSVKALPEKERVATTLFYINGYSHQEISAFLEVPLTTVNHRLRASRKHLKEKLFTMVADDLQEKRPSKDDSFARKVQLFNAAEIGNVDKVKELLNNESTLEALYDVLNIPSDKQDMPVEELVVLIEKHKNQVEYEASERKKEKERWEKE